MTQNIGCKKFFKIGCFERGLSKSLKKVNFLFSFEPVFFDGQCYQKQKESGTQVQKHFFIHYLLSDQVWWCNVKQFLSYSENYVYKFMEVSSWHHKLFHFHLSFWILKAWKWREKTTKIWISLEQKELSRWNKKHFS